MNKLILFHGSPNYQWYYNIPSSEVINKVPRNFLVKAYHGLHDLDLELAVKKVGEQ